MALTNELEKQGKWLFRFRSYLPLLIFPILLIALRDSEILERLLGHTANELWEIFCLTISLIGLIIRSITVGYSASGTSGRTTKEPVAKTLNTTGMYSIVRHPLYLGNFIITLGIALFVEVWWFSIICILSFWLYYERIIFAEEKFLDRRFGKSFTEWAVKTPMILPRFESWQPSELPFSFKKVLRKERTGFLAIIVTFTVLDIGADFFVEGIWEFEFHWQLIFAVGLITYITLWILGKKTSLLDS